MYFPQFWKLEIQDQDTVWCNVCWKLSPCLADGCLTASPSLHMVKRERERERETGDFVVLNTLLDIIAHFCSLSNLLTMKKIALNSNILCLYASIVSLCWEMLHFLILTHFISPIIRIEGTRNILCKNFLIWKNYASLSDAF